MNQNHRFPLPTNCTQVNTINCFLFLPHYFSPDKHQELLGHTVSQITLGTKTKVSGLSVLKTTTLWSNIRNSLWIGMSPGEIGNEELGPLRQEVQGREDGGAVVCTHRHNAYSVTQVWNLFLSCCSGRSLVSAKTQIETALTLSFLDSLSTPLMLAQSVLIKEKL